MLPSRLRATASLAPASSLARRPAFSTACAASRRALVSSPGLSYPRHPRHISTNSGIGRDLSSAAAQTTEATAVATDSAGSSSSAHDSPRRQKPVLPSRWIDQNISVPKPHAVLLAEAKAAAATEAAKAPAGATATEAQPDEADATATTTPPAATSDAQAVVERLEAESMLLPREEVLETLSATLCSSLLVGPRESQTTEVHGDPVVGIYCPVEDAGLTAERTMREVAGRLGAELVIVDAVELCAEGEGSLGRSTSAISLSPNPLKIRLGEATNNQATAHSTKTGVSSVSRFSEEDEIDEEEEEEEADEEDEEDDFFIEAPSNGNNLGGDHAQHAVGASEHTRNSRARKRWTNNKAADTVFAPAYGKVASVKSSSELPAGRTKSLVTYKPTSTEQKLSTLFGELMVAPATASATSYASQDGLARFIYVKNAHLVAPTFDTPNGWFSCLKQACLGRRAMGHPTSIVLGLGPTLLEPISPFQLMPSPKITLPPGLEELMPPGYLEQHTKRMKEIEAHVPGVFVRRAALEQPIDKLKAGLVEETPGEGAVLKARLAKMVSGEWGSLIPPFSSASSFGSNTGSIGRPLFGGTLTGGAGSTNLANLPGMLQNVLGKGNVAVMEFPFVPANSGPLKDLIAGISGGGGSGGSFRPFSVGGSGGSPSFNGGMSSSGPQKVIWKMVGVFPRRRAEPERRAALLARLRLRARINELLVKMALADSRGEYAGGLDIAAERVQKELVDAWQQTTPVDPSATEKADDKPAAAECTIKYDVVTSVLPWDSVVRLAGDAVGRAIAEKAKPDLDGLPTPQAAEGPSSTPAATLVERPRDVRTTLAETGAVPVKWNQLVAAAERDFSIRTHYLELFEPDGKGPDAKESNTASGTEGGKSKPEEKDDAPDPVVEALKKDGSLNKYEKKVLSTIVDRRRLREGFDDVHLPEKTIDAIRSVVSLPLLFPEAFSTGILKNHATSGALLFGPPGTGKTLVVRALAKESGARMMSIQPSDVMDMYMGEAEKLVKAVFSVARRLSPCIVFIDELDALFEARSGGSKGGGDSARRAMLTEFMQEMDGLSSATKNKDQMLSIVGATNRPQDLDEAVLRRLPRRLMIDLPAEKEREAILRLLLKTETLADDVDLAKLAKDTATFSGSDLKHLCVMAAQEAIKEQFSVPWLAKKPVEAFSAASDAVNAPPPSPSSSKPAKATIGISVTADPAPSSTPEPVAEPVTPATTEAAANASIDAPTSASLRDQPAVERVAVLESGEAGSTSTITSNEALAVDSTASNTVTPSARMTESDHEQPLTPPPTEVKHKPRVLTQAHFAYALKNSSSSGSEELGALPELRKWNEQFGDAGTKKNKRSGFGKGFGFGDCEVKKP